MSTPGQKVAYIISRFPTTSETFILYEILELERQGTPVELFSLVRHPQAVNHAGAQALDARAHYGRLLSGAVLAAQLYWLLRRPRAYLATWGRALWENWRSPKHLSRALVVVPVAAAWARTLQRLPIAHVHAHWATHTALAAYVVHRLTGMSYSFTAHADDIYLDQSMLGEKLQRARFVVTISEYNRAFLRQRYGAAATAKVSVVHCGVDPASFTPRPRRTAGAPWTLICVGRLSEKKGQNFLVEACAQLKAAGVPLRCWLVGDGEDEAALRAQIERLGLADEVHLLGAQPQQQVIDLLAQADVAVLPSVTTARGRKEGIAVALMEALAMAVPVVSTQSSGTPELVVDGVTGKLVPERDVPALVAALQALRADPALAERLGAAGRVKVLQEFNLTRNVARLQQMFLAAPAPMPAAPAAERATQP